MGGISFEDSEEVITQEIGISMGGKKWKGMSHVANNESKSILSSKEIPCEVARW